MGNFSEAEWQTASEMLGEKLEEMNEAVQINIAPIHDYNTFTIQKAFFKCGYDCFDRSKSQEEVNNCVDNCIKALAYLENTHEREIVMFQEKMNRSLIVCLQKYGEAGLQQKTSAESDLTSCVDQLIQKSLKTLPDPTNKLKAFFGNSDNSSS